MNSKFTLKQFVSAFLVLTLPLLTLSATAQENGCKNEKVIWLETFGQGTDITEHPDVINLWFRPGGNDFRSEGIYRVANNVQQLPEWHNSGDHTGDADGKMLVINGEVVPFFQKKLYAEDVTGFTAGFYSFSLYAMNANELGVCAPDPLLPELQLIVEYEAGGSWYPLTNSPYTAAKIPQSATPTWVLIQNSFYLPETGFQPTTLRITIANNTPGGCGNDFAIDDIQFSFCPEGGPVPVTFMDVVAKQKGSGVSVEWSTSQEINNDRFEVERSADGNGGWTTVATVAGAGNSQLARYYNAFDANPQAGLNYYRINQIDKDGKSSYSKTVSAKIDNAGSRVSVIGNPFRHSFVVKFAGAAQEVTARLLDMTGKQVARDIWSVPNGESSKQFANTSGLQNGMYILTIHSKSGELLFNGKVMKQ